jgi:glycosyltransferase involved in cell wall biosynthesis
MKFSIGLPIIKSDFLDETLVSIKDQTYVDYEVIIQNNAAEVSERSKIKELVQPYLGYSNFKYFENDVQLGMSENFNSILNRSGGDYFTILSDDDAIAPDFLKWINDLIIEYNECYLFHCRVKIINGSNELLDISPICPAFETQSDFIYQRMSNMRIQFLSDFVVHTEKFKAIYGFNKFETGWGLDDLAWFKMAVNGVGYTHNVGLYYRLHPGGLTSSKKFESRFNDINYFIDEVSKITTDSEFVKHSIYPPVFFERQIKICKEARYRAIFTQYMVKQSISFIILFYLKNRNKYSFKISYIHHTIKNKV